jgi:hypothetical protein
MISDEAGFRKEFERYVKLLGLGDWHILLRFLPPLADAWARIDPAPHASYADMEVGTDLLEKPWSYQRSVMLHELMHLMVRDMVTHAHDVVATLDITARERALIIASLKQHEELVVDGLACALEPVL